MRKHWLPLISMAQHSGQDRWSLADNAMENPDLICFLLPTALFCSLLPNLAVPSPDLVSGCGHSSMNSKNQRSPHVLLCTSRKCRMGCVLCSEWTSEILSTSLRSGFTLRVMDVKSHDEDHPLSVTASKKDSDLYLQDTNSIVVFEPLWPRSLIYSRGSENNAPIFRKHKHCLWDNRRDSGETACTFCNGVSSTHICMDNK